MQNKWLKRESSALSEGEKRRKKTDPDNAMLFWNAAATMVLNPHTIHSKQFLKYKIILWLTLKEKYMASGFNGIGEFSLENMIVNIFVLWHNFTVE